jgi:hypothetical protein
MQVSPKKRAANRRNALKSTGPKTGPGRRVSAQNAARHGLSVPLPQHINDPLQNELAQLIELDGIATDVAQDLAQKIIDYERNLQFLREVFRNEMIDAQEDNPSKHSINLVARKGQEKLENYLANIHNKWLKGMPWEGSNIVRLAEQVNTIIIGAQKKERVNSRRYFKRSSNQLIKALRRL